MVVYVGAKVSVDSELYMGVGSISMETERHSKAVGLEISIKWHTTICSVYLYMHTIMYFPYIHSLLTFLLTYLLDLLYVFYV